MPVEHLLRLAVRGLAPMYLATTREVVRTVRGVPCRGGVLPEGTSLRYAAIVALGLHRSDIAVQRKVLAGVTAAGLTVTVASRAHASIDPGAVALAAWAAAEVETRCDTALFDRIRMFLRSREPLKTVDVGWMLSAAVAARHLGETRDIAAAARRLLLEHQGPGGLFPHSMPPESLGRVRAHVACFADQVYPIQALARFAAATADADALDAANRCARRICALQGDAGQWWWHYDARGSSVVERFPVYSVHQHAMAPMALLDLLDAGGDDHRPSVALGLAWLVSHPEVRDDLVDEGLGVVWRKVGRHEPPKAVRTLNAVTTAMRPGLVLPGVDRFFPATLVDRECRPYELGWLLYAWLGRDAITTSREPAEGRHV